MNNKVTINGNEYSYGEIVESEFFDDKSKEIVLNGEIVKVGDVWLTRELKEVVITNISIGRWPIIDNKERTYTVAGITDFDFKVSDFDLMTKDYFGSRKISFKPKLIFSQFIDSEKKIKITGNITVFKLNQIYETHEDSIEEIYKRFDISSPFYIGSISKILKELKTSEEEFYRYYFRNYYQSIDFNKRPLAKLDRDIYEKFKLISSSN